MKNIFIASFLSLNILFGFSQINQDGRPLSLGIELSSLKNSEIIEAVSDTWISENDIETEKNGSISYISKNFATNFNLNNSGVWTELKKGDRIWRLKIKAVKAKAINTYFNDFYLPEGSKLFIYNEDYSQIIGAFTNQNNNEAKQFATELIYGNTMIIEYYEPHSQFNMGKFTINTVSSYFRDVNNYKDAEDFGDSDPCEVNINCSEGDNWQDEKKGVARIVVYGPDGQGWCSGSLVNNTAQDCKPYFLTAYHCGNNSSTSDFNNWIFYFNYEFDGCSSSSTEPSESQSMTGSSVIARSNDLNTTSSDFLLLELNDNVPEDYNAYFNGWDNENTTPTTGVGIHHPYGDVKKISKYSDNAISIGITWSGTSYTYTTGSTHWGVYWDATANGHGVTEGGSSGSPLFNSTGNIIGTLTGGGSSCANTSNSDHYGKVYYHWVSNNTASNRQLKPWLDPTDSGVSSLAGTYSCSSIPEPEDTNVYNIPLYDDFESDNAPGDNWEISNSDDDISWAKTTDGTGSNSSNCMYMDNWDYEDIGQLDWLVSKIYDFSSESNEELYFDYAYTYYQGSSASYDTLIVGYSVDGGNDFYILWKKGGEELATLENGLDVEFIPTQENWKRETISLASLQGESSVIFAFIGKNGWGNNLYLDNVLVGKDYVSLSKLNNINTVNIAPNPAKDYIQLNFGNTYIEELNISFYNSLGQNVYSQTLKSNLKSERINIEDLPKGLYFIKIRTQSQNQKIIRFIKE